VPTGLLTKKQPSGIAGSTKKTVTYGRQVYFNRNEKTFGKIEKPSGYDEFFMI